MQTKPDSWRESVGAALDRATPVAARLVQSLEPMAPAAPAPITGARAPDLANQLNSWSKGIDLSIRRPAWVGVVMMVVFVGGLGFWATTAPLTSAVVSHGTFVATGQNKIVQHLEGGIISQLLVSEGEEVQPGQPLIKLDDTQSRAEVSRYEIKRASLLATKARLDAERLQAKTITFPDELTGFVGNPEVAKAIAAQQSLFTTRQDQLDTERQINESQIVALEHQIEGLKAQKTSTQQQLDLLTSETEADQKLLDKGLIERSRVLEMQRNQARLTGDLGQAESDIGKAEQEVLQTKANLTQLRTKIYADGADLYRETTADLSDTEQRLNEIRGVLDRQTIRAPVHGVIVKMSYHTTGGVIPPNQIVLEILPTDEKLIVEAQVPPQEIDFVHVGQVASIRLTALNQRTTPLVDGTVTYVSADKITNPSARTPGSEYYYIARIELDEANLKDRVGKIKILPGMPAEVYLKTGERTMFQYLARPIIDVMYKGGREK